MLAELRLDRAELTERVGEVFSRLRQHVIPAPPSDDADDYDLLAAWGEGSTRAAELLSRRHYASIRRFFDLRHGGQEVTLG